jgi:hypothetical protein
MPNRSLPSKSAPDGFINVPVSKQTRDGLHELKVAMNVSGQAEVIEKLVAIGLAIQKAAQ